MSTSHEAPMFCEILLYVILPGQLAKTARSSIRNNGNIPVLQVLDSLVELYVRVRG